MIDDILATIDRAMQEAARYEPRPLRFYIPARLYDEAVQLGIIRADDPHYVRQTLLGGLYVSG